MVSPEHIEQIEKFLAGELEGSDRAAFEQQMAENPEFADEVAFHGELQKLLKTSPENTLRKTLLELDAGVKPEAPNEGKVPERDNLKSLFLKGLGIALLVLAFVFVGYKIFQNRPSAPEPIQNTVEEKKPDALPPIIEKSSESEPEITPEENIVPEKPGNKKPPAENASLFAANFIPNPLLESQIQNGFRGNNLKFTIATPLPLQSIPIEDGKVLFHLSGEVLSASDVNDQNLSVLLFSNKREAYERFRALWSEDLVFIKTTEGYKFSIKGSFDLSPGLYYYLIEDTESGDIFSVGNFKVIQ